MRALVDSVVRDVLYACRLFRRAPLVALTIVTTVGLGLGLVAVVFTILNAVIFRVDEVRNSRELFAVERQRSAIAEPERFTRPQYEALVRETGVFSDAFASGPAVDSWIDGQRMQGSLVTGNFFHVLGVSAARGRTFTLSDDEPGAGRAIVLSHRGWSRLFASDPRVLNRTLVLGRVPFQVAGVMPEGFRGLEVAAPDFWAPLSLLGEFRPGQAGREDLVPLNIIGRLKPGVSLERALAQLIVWDSRRAADVSGKRPVANLVLEPRQGTVPLSTDALMVFTPLFIAFGLILMVGCANVANLLLARAVARQREIAIRLAIGASRRRIIGQLLTESLVLALVSAALAFGISRLVLEATLHAFFEHPAARSRRHSRERAASRLARRGVSGCRRLRNDRVLRARAGPSGHPSRAGASDARRGGARSAPQPRAERPRCPSGNRIRPAPHLLCDLPAQRAGGSEVRPRFPHSRYRHCRHHERADARDHARRREERTIYRRGCGCVAWRGGRAGRLCRRRTR